MLLVNGKIKIRMKFHLHFLAFILFLYCDFASAGRPLVNFNFNQPASVVHQPTVAGNVPAAGLQILHNTHGGKHHPIFFNHHRFAHKPTGIVSFY
jgi:hypothetical protein